MGGCQNNDPFLDSYCNTAPYIEGTQKGDYNLDKHPYQETVLFSSIVRS